MKDEFTCSTSDNVLRVDFHSDWDHTRFYQTIFHATGVIAQRTFVDKNWALLINWKHQLIMTPEEERICVRTIGRHITNGLTAVVNVIDPHPIAEWQLEKVAKCSSDILAEYFHTCEEGEAFLRQQGFNTTVTKVEFDPEWVSATKEFSSAVSSLGLDPKAFIHQ